MATDYTTTLNTAWSAISGQANATLDSASIAVYNAGLNNGTLTMAQVYTALESEPFVQNITNPIIRLYQAAFGRLPDTAGLNVWVDHLAHNPNSFSWMVSQFAYGTEFKTLFGVDGSATINTAVITAFYNNFLNRTPTAAEVANWVGSGMTVANALALCVNSTEFSNGVSAGITTYQNLLGAGTPPTSGTLFTLTTHAGQTYTLTTGQDTFTGTSANDTFVATWSAAANQPFGPLDVLNGNGGNDVLQVSDTATATGTAFSFNGATITNIANLSLATSGTAVDLDLTGLTGLTNATLSVNGGAATGIKLASTTNATVTDAFTNANISIASGGAKLNLTTNGSGTIDVGATGVGHNDTSATSLTLKTGTGAIHAYGSALTDVTVNGGGAVTIDNTDATGATGAGSTLTSVALNNDAGATISGKGLASVTLSTQGAAGTAQMITITDTTAKHALTVNANGTGYSTAGVAESTVVQDNNATTLNVVATGKNAVTLGDNVGATLKTLTVGGTGALALTTTDGVSEFSTLTSIDLSANSGGVTMTDNSAAAVLKGGSGNDVVTLTAALTSASGASIDLGTGNNELLAGAGGSIGAGVSVNGGAGGNNTISASLITVGNASGITNFQNVDVSSFSGTVDSSFLGTTLNSAIISTGDTSATLLNLGSAVTITDSYDNVAANTLTLTHAGGTGTLTVNFADAVANSTVAAISFSSLTSTGDTAVTINGTNATNAVVDTITTLNETDNHLTTITLTGANKFLLGTVHTDTAATLTADTASSLVKIDASATTGGVTITAGATDTVTTHNLTYTGLTILGGTGGDTIENDAANGVITEGATASTHTNTLKVTATGASINDAASAGADIITLGQTSANVGTMSATLGSGTGVTVNVAATSAATVHSVTDTVTFGSGTATVNDLLTFNDTVTNTSNVTDGNYLVLNSAAHGNQVALGSAAATFVTTAVNVSSAQTLDQALVLAESATHNAIQWFTAGNNTYIVDSGAAAGSADNFVVKIAGTVDLSHATLSGHTLTFA